MKRPTIKEVTNLLGELRKLAPNRPLTYGESIQVARLQAARFRAWIDASDEPAVNLAGLVNQRVITVHFVPSHVLNEESGLTTDLMDDKLQVFINEGEPQVRQRFSLLHEWKHVLDFPNASNLHRNLGVGNDNLKSIRVELIANEFAAHVLMPTHLVKRVWFKTQDTTLAASLFNVSPEAMNTRLTKLGLINRKPQPTDRVAFRTHGLMHLSDLAPCAA
jgi:Zn-dependent peptidase ImmA (M78 family)